MSARFYITKLESDARNFIGYNDERPFPNLSSLHLNTILDNIDLCFDVMFAFNVNLSENEEQERTKVFKDICLLKYIVRFIHSFQFLNNLSTEELVREASRSSLKLTYINKVLLEEIPIDLFFPVILRKLASFKILLNFYNPEDSALNNNPANAENLKTPKPALYALTSDSEKFINPDFDSSNQKTPVLFQKTIPIATKPETYPNNNPPSRRPATTVTGTIQKFHADTQRHVRQLSYIERLNTYRVYLESAYLLDLNNGIDRYKIQENLNQYAIDLQTYAHRKAEQFKSSPDAELMEINNLLNSAVKNLLAFR